MEPAHRTAQPNELVFTGRYTRVYLDLPAWHLALAGSFDVAVRDVVLSLTAFTLARALEVGVRLPDGPHVVAAVAPSR
jgi:hypothetical protein